MLSKISRRMMQLAGIGFALAAQNALAQRIPLQACKEQKQAFPTGWIVTLSTPFNNIQLMLAWRPATLNATPRFGRSGRALVNEVRCGLAALFNATVLSRRPLWQTRWLMCKNG
ncbi:MULTISPECIES: hypothetical protein [unclassified Massilia]|uniref:hypothetical protein n=1 Tax=unclassified Massilia TaxID=2609279 RepID=UPI00177C1118|nr:MULTISPECIES: hypothetical protein [unclassified Massilia]MBD8531080.1 hypothetical protein [Massilia sp. CFBP 13647]MBD8674780.1 hypothetical protein [Massilia sp. CFBP 13721]